MEVKQLTNSILEGENIREVISEATINNLKYALEGWFDDWNIVKTGNNLQVDGPFVDIPCEVYMSIEGNEVSVVVMATIDNQPFTAVEKCSFDSKEEVKQAVEKAYNKVAEQWHASKDSD